MTSKWPVNHIATSEDIISHFFTVVLLYKQSVCLYKKNKVKLQGGLKIHVGISIFLKSKTILNHYTLNYHISKLPCNIAYLHVCTYLSLCFGCMPYRMQSYDKVICHDQWRITTCKHHTDRWITYFGYLSYQNKI